MIEILSLAYPLFLTIGIEYIIVQLFSKDKIVLWQVCLINIITNPAINLIYRYILVKKITENTLLFEIITLLEIAIWILEAVIYKYLLKINWIKAFLYSITANATSYLISFII